MTITGISKLERIMKKNNSLLCVGLDSEIHKLPSVVLNESYPQFVFNKAIIDATHPYVCAYKPNMAFYEARGAQGIVELTMTMEYITTTYPDIFTICDAKRADIGNTNNGYVEFIFDHLKFDAITLHPYLGREALMPFLDRKDKVSIILCKTSNPGSGEFQNMDVEQSPLFMRVARQVATVWNVNRNCMVVVGATYPEEMKMVREIAPQLPFLVPGIGAQGGDVEETVKAGLDTEKRGMIINSSRGIIFASNRVDFAEKAGHEANKLREAINKYR